MQKPVYLWKEFYALIDFMPLPTVVFYMPEDPFDDTAHNTHYVNKAFTEVMGYEMADIPDHLSLFQLAFPDSTYRQEVNHEWQNNIIKPLDIAGDYISSAIKIKCKNNDERWFKIYTELRRKIFPELYIVSFYDQTIERENNKLQEMCVSTDPLTNVANKQFILKSINDEVARVNRFGNPFSLLIAHFDNLVAIKKDHGQDGVAYVLKTVAGLLKSKVRKIDLISRWDDDKFLILIPRANTEQAYKVNEIILEKIKEYPFHYNETTLHVSVTIGIAEYQINENVTNTIARADSALYFGKSAGNGYIVRAHSKNNYAPKSRFTGK